MKNFIKELYYGNIDPQARGFKNGSYLKKQMTILSESESRCFSLSSTLRTSFWENRNLIVSLLVSD